MRTLTIIVLKCNYLYLKKSNKGLRKKITFEVVLKKCPQSRVLSREYSMAVVQHTCILSNRFCPSSIRGDEFKQHPTNASLYLLHTFFFRTASGILFLLENRRIQETQICKRVPSSQFPIKVNKAL